MKAVILALALALFLAGCTGFGSGAKENGSAADNSAENASNRSTGSQEPPQPLPDVNVTKLSERGLSMGSEDAPVIMVEFSDYQCQFCRRFWEVNFATLKEQYIDTGKVQFVYRDFPLSFHNAAEDSAIAVACANEQGKGWEMHDKIFAVQSKVGTGLVFYARSDLKQWAGEMGLDRAAFDLCMDSGRYLDELNESKNEGMSIGFNATPSFVMGLRHGANYVTLVGALPYGTFRGTLDQLLNDSG